jgi:hypothetical protein
MFKGFTWHKVFFLPEPIPVERYMAYSIDDMAYCTVSGKIKHTHAHCYARYDGLLQVKLVGLSLERLE